MMHANNCGLCDGGFGKENAFWPGRDDWLGLPEYDHQMPGEEFPVDGKELPELGHVRTLRLQGKN